jgi:hypothetical protein
MSSTPIMTQETKPLDRGVRLLSTACRALLGLAVGATMLAAMTHRDQTQVPADAVTHCAIAYGLTVLGLGAWRWPRSASVGLTVLGAGYAMELLQWLHGFPGEAQVRDLVADTVGVAAGLGPVLLDRASRIAAGRDASLAPARPLPAIHAQAAPGKPTES